MVSNELRNLLQTVHFASPDKEGSGTSSVVITVMEMEMEPEDVRGEGDMEGDQGDETGFGEKVGASVMAMKVMDIDMVSSAFQTVSIIKWQSTWTVHI